MVCTPRREGVSSVQNFKRILPPPNQTLGGLVALHMRDIWFVLPENAFETFM